MFSILRQPYAVLEPPRAQVRSAVLIGVFVALFLLIFQPFNLNLWQTDHKEIKLIGFGLVTFLITTLTYVVWPALFPNFFVERRWTVGRSVGFVLFNVLCIAVGNFLYLGYLLQLPFGWDNLFWTLSFTLTVGVFPVGGTILYGYVRKLRQYEQGASQMQVTHNERVDKDEEEPTLITNSDPTQPLTLVADNEKDTISLPPANLLYIESSDNYCTIYHLQNGKLHKPLLRSSLGRLEAQLVDHPRLVRCHRSFVVNLDRVERVTGNAQGYKLHLLDGQLEVPVARRYNETLVTGLKR
ncbi:MAG: LytTR family transcriptional regulator [Cytophagales bacterium]|nr:MAG: LytTR family transcriptional regulator [Cytophagales bacterium]